ncbi:hypothetical protein C8250_034745 [Streptomyces sp. So13.3]|uniref:hypothetical protein n=1 Tax=Streptomyces TaxID=1883 RepID=UPI00110704D6|nr:MULTISPECIES: hypothetical protein [unclassified Streptomyces]MCZ4101589.1 hypothetical protein [Streptomyces sp. H39-C1]QNA76342.1 hypothetical protein C8250_034745 [Streptomyces sp. So13.3]
MNNINKVGAFAAGLAVTFGASFGIGHAIGPVGSQPTASHSDHGAAAGTDGNQQPADTAPGGLQVSERGYTLVPSAEPIAVGAPRDFRFRITGPDGKAVTRYTSSHEKDLHLIVARRDLSGFQHLHPRLSPDGTWSVPLAFDAAGTYRVFADFVPSGSAGLTLGADLFVAGDYRPSPLPAPARTATVDGYTVTLAGDLTAGKAGMLTLSVAKDNRPVTDLQPYLGAYGHLVALRQGDLAYLHVHPEGAPGDGTTPAGPGISFHAVAPSVGTYRLYLDFRHGGTVHTAQFTVIAGASNAAAPSAPEHSDHSH